MACPNIFNSRYNLHVIYLARDPRGILNSVRALPSQWPTRLLSPLHICSRYSPTPDLYTDMWFLRAMFSKGYSTTPSTYPLTISPRSFPLKLIKLRTVQWLPWFPQITILKYEDLASQPSEELAAIEEKFNISLTSKEVNTLIRSCDGGVITFGKDNGGNMSLSTIWPKYVPDAEVLVRSQQQFGQLGSH